VRERQTLNILRFSFDSPSYIYIYIYICVCVCVCVCLHVKCLLLASKFNEICIIAYTFPNNTQIQNFMRILPVGIGLFHADGRTDRHDETNSRLSQYCERAEEFIDNNMSS